MKNRLYTVALSLAAACAVSAAEPAAEKPAMVVAVGTGGADQYEMQFENWAKQWRLTADKAGITPLVIGDPADPGSKESLARAFTEQAKTSPEPLWVILIGHGTWDGKTAKFNLKGDDVSAPEMAEWLKPFDRPLIVVAAFSTSGAWLNPLTGPGRIVLTATRSGSEENFARFGEFLPGSFSDTNADLDKDGQVSLLEAWLTAARQTAEFYTNEGRLATEHSLLEDNGDGRGTPSDWFQGVRAVKKSKDNASPDGIRAHQIHLLPNPAERALPAPIRAERDAIELQIAKLREAKSSMTEDVYYRKLEELFLRLAKVYGD